MGEKEELKREWEKDVETLKEQIVRMRRAREVYRNSKVNFMETVAYLRYLKGMVDADES